MGTKLTLECDGCFKTITSTDSLNRAKTVSDIIPEDWVWSDPYTKCTYCPLCWAGIISVIDNE